MTATGLSSGITAGVDAHVHVSRQRPTGTAPLVVDAPIFDAPVSELCSAMAAAGVAQAVLVQPTMHGFDHRQLVDALTAYPRSTRGVAIADPRAPQGAQQLRSLTSGGRVTGVRLLPLVAPAFDWLDDTSAWLADVAAELGLCIELLIGPDSLAEVGRWASRRPDVTVVIEHLGRPDLGSPGSLPALLRLAECATVHVKVSALHSLSREPFPHRDIWPLLRTVLAEFGAGRLMWGSDYPFTATARGYADALSAVELALPQLEATEHALLFGGTARSVYRLPALPIADGSPVQASVASDRLADPAAHRPLRSDPTGARS